MRENTSTHTQAPTTPRKRATGPQNEADEAAGALWWLLGEGRTYGPYLTELDGWRALHARTPTALQVLAAKGRGWRVVQGAAARMAS